MKNKQERGENIPLAGLE